MKQLAITTLIISFFLACILVPPAAADQSWSSWVKRNIKTYEKDVEKCKAKATDGILEWYEETDGKNKKMKLKVRKATNKDIQVCINKINDSFVRRLLKPSDDEKKLYRISKKLKKKKYRKRLRKAKKEKIANSRECMSVKEKVTKTFLRKCSNQSWAVYWTRVNNVAKDIIADGKKAEKKLK